MSTTQQFPITPLRDQVVIELKAKVSILLEGTGTGLKNADIIHSKVVCYGNDVTDLTVGDNIILNPSAVKIAINIKDNDKDPNKVVTSARNSKLVGQNSTKREVIAYYLINKFDILAIDNQ